MIFAFALGFALAAAAAAAALAEDPCPKGNINNFYRELSCEPIFENASKCPSSYSCDKFRSRNRAKCNYRGDSYELGEVIPAEKSDPCFAHCVCVQSGQNANFACAVVDCPDFWLPPLPEKCVRLYKPEVCCSTGQYCANETSSVFTCQVDGKSYFEGQRFFPSSDPCKRCHCMPGFTGELVEPFCEDISCNMELVNDYRLKEDCVPVYYGKQGCCPINWKCPPAASARVISRSGNDTISAPAKCKFGNLELNRHDVLEDDDVKCECAVPPYLTCFAG